VYTIKEVMLLTNKYFPTRIHTKNRDVLKRITIKEQKVINRKDKTRPQIKFVVETYSYPQYAPYIKGKRGEKQRKYRHQYDSTLELDRLSLNTEHWVYRLGSGQTWITPSQNNVKQIYKETRIRLKKKADRKGKTNKEKTQLYQKEIDKIRKRAKYLSVGDYNAQVRGVNADFYFRDAWALSVHNHLFGRQYSGLKPSPKTNPNNIPFFPKHGIALIEKLIESGVLKND